MSKKMSTHAARSTGEEMMRYWADSSAFPPDATVEEVNASINGLRVTDVDFSQLSPMDAVEIDYGWVLDSKGIAIDTLAGHFLAWQKRTNGGIWLPSVKVTNSSDGKVSDITASFVFGGKEKVVARAQFSAAGEFDVFTNASGKFVSEEDLSRYIATLVEFHSRVQASKGV